MHKVADVEDWRSFLLNRVSNAPVHVILTAPAEEEIGGLVLELCGESEVYAIYVPREAASFVPVDLTGCEAPVFLVSDEREAQSFATKLIRGDLTVLDNAVNGDEMLYRFLSAHPT